MNRYEPIEDCVFCKKLATNNIEAYAHDVGMFTPLNPVTPGHKLFVSRFHSIDAAHEPIITGSVFQEAAFYAKAQAKPFNLITSAGKEATQSILHFHVHYVPRSQDDKLHLPWTDQKEKEI